MFARQSHGGIEADQAEPPGDGNDQVAHCLAYFREQEVELGRVVPGHVGAVVAVIDVTALPGAMILVFIDNSCITMIPVAVFDANAYFVCIAKIRSTETVGWVGWLIGLQKPVGMLFDPLGIDTGMVGNHVASETNAVIVATLLEVLQGLFATEVFGNPVCVQCIGGGFRFWITRELFDAF